MDCTWAVFSALAARDVPVVLPPVAVAEACVLLVAVPVVVGSFAVSLASSSNASYDRLAVVAEGVVAWRDRDHRYIGMPKYLLGGVLFQGPYKDVPEGTVLTVRPNARSRVYAIVERSSGGGLPNALPAAGWKQEAGAPRWHDTPTMVTFGRSCAAGCALSLPPTQGAGVVLSIVVVPISSVPVAPVEVSYCCSADAAQQMSPQYPELEMLGEGAPWDLEGRLLTKVPLWMQGAAYLPTSTAFGASGPPAGTIFSVRAAPPSVVYVIVEEQRDGGAGRFGGLLPEALPAAGWEKRAEAPEAGMRSQLAVYAKRVSARECLSLPLLKEAGAVLGLVVKVDMDAFDATVETSGGLEFQRADFQETVIAWSDTQFRYTWVPTPMTPGILFRGPHSTTPSGTVVYISASGACRVYIIVEAEYKGGMARDGGFLQSLARAGWRVEATAPSWNDTKSVMKVLSIRASEGSELALPPTRGEAVFSVVVVNIASSPDRLADEMKQSFRAWDSEGLEGIRREDLDALLAAACPAVDAKGRAALLADADPHNTGKINYTEFMGKVLFANPSPS
mmetsp:Transcript_27312/g.76845  ORF Transcript_27312/g.76845 Transcript_27312/m.76845 type:complete len:563 (+) Transcript_27312:2-1690(+)